ncbi:MAG: glycoside hydrolase family 2 [Bacteroidales bacterium]|nr:glycoside hydrolase family 2 [Bacteroidales bacterium]
MKKVILYLAFISVVVACNDKQTEGIMSFTKLLKQDWKILSNQKINSDGKSISQVSYSDTNWYKTSVPSTVLNSLINNKVYNHIYQGMNINKIDKKQFKSSWWYRKEFTIENSSTTTLLEFEGINYKANIWLNGKQIATKNEIINPFKQYILNISKYIQKGKNILAVEVFPPQKGDYTIGFVDWNPAPPDNNMGIFRDVKLGFNEGVEILNPFIESVFSNNNFQTADLIFTAELHNYLNKDIQGEFQLNINGTSCTKQISLNAGETKKVLLNSKEFKQLHIENPKLWWPHTIGTPNLYKAEVHFSINNKLSDRTQFKFGIRKIEDYFTKEGHRGFKINGQKISIRGGGWVDNLTLNNTYDNIKAQLEYVRDMNLNTIRLEGFWGTDQTLYNLCDEMGILIMVGWSCHWEWENYLGKFCDEKYGGILSDEDIDLMSAAWKDQVVWLRNHPAIFTWMSGSDCIPKPKLEQKYFDIFNEYDSTRVYLASAKEWESLAGQSGVKMRGPYAYVPPVYWYSDTLYGGAFGFNTETGPGAQVPPIESIKKMIPEEHLWPIDSVWDFHCGRNEFNTLDRYTKALNKRYGAAKNVEEYAFKAQMLNYELMRPMFEAFSINRYKATGVIQWMLNSAWPEMYWQLYDYYLMPNGAYFGAKKAGEPVHAIYNYQTNAVWLANDLLENADELSMEVKMYDKNSKLIFSKTKQTNINANSAREVLKLPEIKNLSKVYFLSIKLFDIANNEIDNNFYWLSTRKDVLDYKTEVSPWNYHTPSKQYADFTGIEKLPEVTVESSVNTRNSENDEYFDISLTNQSKSIAFFIELRIVDKNTGETILPVIWTDNYISLLPGEQHKYTAKINKKYLKNKKPFFVMKGWNLK